MAATYNGSAIFGYAVSVTMVPAPQEVQFSTFFGLSGVHSLTGGTRGRIISVTGLLYGASLSALNAAEAAILAYADGIARTFVDTRGRSWGYVVFNGSFEPLAKPQYAAGTFTGYWLPYRATFEGRV